MYSIDENAVYLFFQVYSTFEWNIFSVFFIKRPFLEKFFLKVRILHIIEKGPVRPEALTNDR